MIRVYLFYLLKCLYNYLLKLNFEVYKHILINININFGHSLKYKTY